MFHVLLYHVAFISVHMLHRCIINVSHVMFHMLLRYVAHTRFMLDSGVSVIALLCCIDFKYYFRMFHVAL
jgi:hypothetical protein